MSKEHLTSALILGSDMRTIRIILAGLISINASSYAASRELPTSTLLPIIVTRGSSQFVGKKVTIRGYLRYGDDARGLWTSQHLYLQARDGDASPDHAIWANCIALNADNQLARRLRALNGKRVLLAGVVSIEPHNNDEVFSFSCNDVALRVSKVVSAR